MCPKSDSPRSEGVMPNGYSLSRTAGSGIRLAISGEIDISNAEAFTDEAHSLLEDAHSEVTLDLENCLFIDSSGIRALVVLAQEQQARGRKVRLSGITGEPRRVLRLTGLLDSDLLSSDGLSHPRRQP